MRAMSSLLGFLLTLLAVLPPLAWSRSFPSTPDATEAEQQRWGASTGGYIAEGCWYGASASAQVTIQPCRAFALDGPEPPALKGFSETAPRTVTFSGGDGRYWLAGRSSPGLALPAWTCLDGTHYCWIKSAQPPLAPAGVVLLASSLVTAGAAAAGVAMAPWRRTQPYSVPAGVTLTLGVCPEAGRWQIFDANGTTTGSIRFAAGACGRPIYPEWWGVDPTGLADTTAAWQAAINAVSHQGLTPGSFPLLCSGTYAISAAAGQTALLIKDGTQIVGSYIRNPGGDVGTPCRFNFTGEGSAIGTVDTGGASTYANMRLENLQIFDVENTGTNGLRLWQAAGTFLNNILIRRFDVGIFLSALSYYGEMRNLRVAGSRTMCMDIAGAVNGQTIEGQCNITTNTTATHGIRVGQTPGLFATSHGIDLRWLIEIDSGIPVSITRVQDLRGAIYIEHPGADTDYSLIGAVQLSRIEGGRLTVRANGQAIGSQEQVNTGIRIFNAEPATRNFTLCGNLINYNIPLVIEDGPGSWGIDTTCLSRDEWIWNADVQSFTTGVEIGLSYLTHGGPPQVDVGRGSTTLGTNWQVGDLIFATPNNDGRIASILRQVTVAGNPPTVKEVAFVTHGTISFASDDATPTVRQGNTYLTRVEIAGGAGATAITDIDDERDGQCLWARATGDRTIVDNANFVFKTPGDKVLTANATLQLCNDAGVWYEY